MYFLALAVDYDGTIAENGHVAPETFEALSRLRDSGRKLLLVTGREIVDLQHACTNLALFDFIVAENGAVLYDPNTRNEVALAPPPPTALLNKLAEYNVTPISVGRSIIATWHPHEQAVMRAIQELGLELQISFNKGAVMVLPTNINKASGLRHALRYLDISPLNIVAAGDAENDHAFLAACGCSAAVANAVPSLKREVDVQLLKDHGEGVAELIDRILIEDHKILPLPRRSVLAGIDRQGMDVYIDQSDLVLVAGNSGCGKSSLMTLLTERMAVRGQEFCVIDPEGDYLQLKDAVTIGGVRNPPATEEALRLLLQAGINVVVNTLALNPIDRKQLFSSLASHVRQLRERTGRPHWLIVDEAHHFMPFLNRREQQSPTVGSGVIIVTIDLHMIDRHVLQHASTLIAMGSITPQLLATFAAVHDVECPKNLPRLCDGEFILWNPASARPPSVLRLEQPRQPHHRHLGKYAAGDVGTERSFYFRGPNLELNLSACNLREFLRLGDEVSDPVWEHHLRAGDYSAWFRHVIRDDVLAREASDIEQDLALSPRASRDEIEQAVLRRYHIRTSREIG